MQAVKLLRQNSPVLSCGCRLTRVDVYDGSKTVVVVHTVCRDDDTDGEWEPAMISKLRLLLLCTLNLIMYSCLT